jgi:hypothetical protein
VRKLSRKEWSAWSLATSSSTHPFWCESQDAFGLLFSRKRRAETLPDWRSINMGIYEYSEKMQGISVVRCCRVGRCCCSRDKDTAPQARSSCSSTFDGVCRGFFLLIGQSFFWQFFSAPDSVFHSI